MMGDSVMLTSQPEPEYSSGSGWEPIDTAPRDGSVVMAYDSEETDPEESVFKVKWATFKDGFGIASEGWKNDTFLGSYLRYPTHWIREPKI